MSSELTREQCLVLPIGVYNMAIERRFEIEKIEKNLSGSLEYCECGRKYYALCICDNAQKRYQNAIDETGDSIKAREKELKMKRGFRTYDSSEIQTVYRRHHSHCGTVVYSTDNGYTWQSVGMDSGKWNLHEWLFAFISID